MEKEKHIFFVHSPITFIVAWGVIIFKQLEREQIIFLTHRGFSVQDTRVKTFEFPFNWSPEPFPFKLNFLRSWERLKNFDLWVNDITNESQFIVYLPHSEFRVLKLFISHENCVEYSYLEEGLGSYNLFETVNPKGRRGKVNFLDQILYKNRIKDRLVYNTGYGAVFGLFEDCFPGFKNKVILDQKIFKDFNFIKSLKMKQDLFLFNNSHIVVLDAVSIQGQVSDSVHFSAIRKLFQKLISLEIEKIFIKFHPAQYNTEEYTTIPMILNEFKDKIEIIEVDKSVFLELVARHCSSVTFYVNISSVGFYAARFGQNIFTWANYLADLDENFRKKLNKLNPVFFNQVTFF